MAKPKPKSKLVPEKPVPEKRWYQNINAIIGLVVAILLGLVAFTDLFDFVKRPPPPVQENFEIVLDCSQGMSYPYDGETKLKKAVYAIENTLAELVTEEDNLAFRIFGGACTDKKTQRAVAFDKNNVNKVLRTLKRIKTNGEPILVRAVLDAVADFNDVNRFKDVNKRIVVITGGIDPCVPNFSEAIQRRLRGRFANGDTIIVDFSFIGLGIPTTQEEQLWQIASKTGGDVFFPESQSALEDAIRKAVAGKPVVNIVGIIRGILNTVIGNLDVAIRLIKEKNFPSAEERLAKARLEFKRINFPLDYLGNRQDGGQIQKLYELAVESRMIQERLLDLCKGTLTEAIQGKANAYEAVAQELNVLIRDYQNKRNEMNKILDLINRQ
ncbi:hypothetical protein L0244_09790 [bacterium]|nr:hypothetical protein [bacterium]